MHELPKDLASSLRSWRASIASDPARNATADIEKGHGAYDEKDFERALSPDESGSMILHPTRSRPALGQTTRHGRQGEGQSDKVRGQQGNTRHASEAQRPSHSAVVKRHPAADQTPNKRSGFTAPLAEDPDPTADRLDENEQPLQPKDFYELMGMKEPLSKLQPPKELAMRHGMYGRILHRFHYVQTKYRIFDVTVYVFLVVQLLLSALFIVFGSLNRSDLHLAIVILGAISTVIAGALALMKGNGLPQRLMQTRDALRNVIFAAEELYWDVGADRPVKFKDVKKIREDYLRVCEEERRNHPDTWNSIPGDMAARIEVGPGKAPKLASKALPKP